MSEDNKNWMDIDGIVKTSLSEKEFKEKFFKWIDDNGWEFKGCTGQLEDDEKESLGGRIVEEYDNDPIPLKKFIKKTMDGEDFIESFNYLENTERIRVLDYIHNNHFGLLNGKLKSKTDDEYYIKPISATEEKVDVNVSLSKWLNELAEQNDINLSHLLELALVRKLSEEQKFKDNNVSEIPGKKKSLSDVVGKVKIEHQIDPDKTSKIIRILNNMIENEEVDKDIEDEVLSLVGMLESGEINLTHLYRNKVIENGKLLGTIQDAFQKLNEEKEVK